MGVELDEGNRLAQAVPRYLDSRRRYGRFIGSRCDVGIETGRRRGFRLVTLLIEY